MDELSARYLSAVCEGKGRERRLAGKLQVARTMRLAGLAEHVSVHVVWWEGGTLVGTCTLVSTLYTHARTQVATPNANANNLEAVKHK